MVYDVAVVGGGAAGLSGALALARSPHLTGLEVLSLAANGITDVGAMALAESPYLRRLRWLGLYGNSVTEETVRRLVERFGQIGIDP